VPAAEQADTSRAETETKLDDAQARSSAKKTPAKRTTRRRPRRTVAEALKDESAGPPADQGKEST
jgi:hypothetical protein